MTRDQVFPSKYIKASDLKDKPCVVTIEDTPFEMLKGTDGKEQHKTVLHFKGTDKTMPLNATNWDSVADVTGCPDSDDWVGHKIELYPAKTHMGGKQVDCIRIRRPANGSSVQPSKPALEYPKHQAGGATIMGTQAARGQPDRDELPDDGIPF